MDAFGVSINPIAEGNQVYEADARTYYLGLVMKWVCFHWAPCMAKPNMDYIKRVRLILVQIMPLTII